MRRLLLLIAASLTVLAVAVPTAGVYFLTFTEKGFQFLISRLPHEVAGVRIEVFNPTGSIANGISVERLEIDHHLIHLRFEGLQGRVHLLPLLLQTIRTQDASIRSITIQVKRRTRPPSKSPPIFLPRWLIVSADRARIGDVVLIVPNGTRLEATDVFASGIARHRKIRFFEGGLQAGALKITLSGEMRATDPLQLDADIRADWRPPDQPAWAAAWTTKGDLSSLAFTGHTLAPFNAEVAGHALDLTDHWHWNGRASVHDLDVTAWGGSNVLGLLSGQLEIKGDPNGFAARGPVQSSGLNVGLFDAQFEGFYADHVLTARHMEITHRASRAHAVGAGSIEVVKNGPRLSLQGKWQNFRWPLVGKDPPVRSASGDFSVEGVWPYTVHLEGPALVRDLPQFPIQVDGALARDGFSFSKADVDLYDGHATLTGGVLWAPARSWWISGHATDVNPERLRSDLPGRLSFAIEARGAGFEPNQDFSVEISQIAGHVRGVAASGAANFARRSGTWDFDRVRVALGRTNLALDGSIGKTFDLRFGLTTQDLSLLSADSRGQLEASGTLRGTSSEPTIAATARGRGVVHDGMALDDFDVSVNFDPRPQFESRIQARFHNFTYRNRVMDHVTFSLNGTPASYAVRLDASALGLATNLQASGPFANGVWQGQLNAVKVIGTQSLHLELERPVEVRVSSDGIRMDRMCLNGQPASLCADATWSMREWNATVTANELPLATLTAGLTQAVDYGGRIDIHAHVFGNGEEPVQGTARLTLIDAQLAHRLSSGRIEHTTIGSGLISINAGRAAVDTHVSLESGEVGTIKGTMQIERSAESWPRSPLHGELHANTEQLALISLYVPEIDRASGHLDADLRIAGTVGAPYMNGDVRISNGEIDYYQVNLGMRQVAFDARLTDSGVEFKGNARIGSGMAEARGQLEWKNSLPYGKVRIEGSNLRVVDVPEAHIEASPELTFNVNGRRIEVAGSVRVPEAKIVPKDLSGAVRSSSDEVIVGQQETDPSKRFEVVSAITLALGDHVSIDTTGLTGRLTGNITVRSGYDSITSATGELSIEQGKYTAYARKLDIQRGRLIFTGGPVANPGIDIRAIKEFPDVKAGVNVRGTLLQPRMSFFSDPSLTQAQIVSLILAGGSLETAQGRQAGAGSEALAQGGAILAQQLGSKVGIEDVSLESDLTNETSLVLGRYLSPRLYVSYGIALTEQLNVLKLRYSLGNRWTVKTEVGQARGADLVYTIER